MRVIGVIDLMGGHVVRGIAGRRDEYRPIESRIASDAQPGTIAGALTEQLGLAELYLADLDAIAGAEPAWDVYHEVLESGAQLWVDAGTGDVECGRALCAFAAEHPGLTGIVVGLETLDSPGRIGELLDVIGRKRLLFSLDLNGGRPLTDAPGWSAYDVREIASEVLEMGVRRMIVLDLARVGTGQGTGTEGVCRMVRELAPGVEITAGGGVRGVDDLHRLAEAGCNAALVASALHDGRLTAADMATLRQKAT